MRLNHFPIKIVTILLLIFQLQPMHAGHVDIETARTVAHKFMDSPSYVSNRRNTIRKTTVSLSDCMQSEAYYVFNVGVDDGFIIVSSDDAFTRPILGYSTQGTFKPDSLPANLSDWLEGYARELEYARSIETTANNLTTQTITAGSPIVGPLLTTTWDQGEPYNNLCTELAQYLGTNAATGCTATALAQVMNYYEWPITGTGSASYSVNYSTGGNNISVNFSSTFSDHTYNWHLMKDNYSKSYTDAEATAVATLMHDCGIALYSQYNSSTGAYTFMPGNALINNFGYDPSLMVRNKNHYTQTEWDALLREELDAKRPMIYSGQNTSSGHAFVCDGYDDAGFFHFNWGWSGYYDGWFVTTSLVPSGTGTGGNVDGYTSDQCAWFGVKKNEGGSRRADFVAGSDFTTTDGITYQYSLNVGYFSSYNTADIQVRCALAIENVSTGNVIYSNPAAANIEGGTSISFTAQLKYSETLAAGLYKVYPVARLGNSGDWELVHFSPDRQNYIVITVDSNGNRTIGYELVNGVTLDKISSTCYVDETIQLTATVLPQSAYNQSIIWTSSNTSVAIVSNTGLVTAVAEGITTITVTTVEGGFAATCIVEVLPKEKEDLSNRVIYYTSTSKVTPYKTDAFGANIISMEYEKGQGKIVFDGDVMTIGEKAFYCCDGLTSITIPTSVTSIGDQAFDVCNNLSNVTVGWEEPLTISAMVFNSVSLANKNLNVPSGTKEIYQKKSVWKTFGTITEYTKIQFNTKMESNTFNLLTGQTLTINDGVLIGMGIMHDIDDIDIIYSRTFKNTNWQPLYVPFDMTVTSDLLQRFSFAKFAGTYTEEDNAGNVAFFITIVRLKEGATIKANTPYFIQAKTADTSNAQTISVDGTTLHKTEEMNFSMYSAEKKLSVYGIYNQKICAYDGEYYAYSAGKYSRQLNGAKLGAFRFYVTIEDREDSPYKKSKHVEIKLKSIDEYEETTGIGSNLIPTLSNSASNEEKLYNLAGQVVDPDYKGIVIKDGKKMYNK